MMAIEGGRLRERVAPVLVPAVLAAAAVALLEQTARRYRRWSVRGESMSPVLREGDWVVVDMKAYRGAAPRRGHVVIASDPRDPERSIVKRVAAVDLHGG